MTNKTINDAINLVKSRLLSDNQADVRIDQQVAKRMISDNESMIVKGIVKHFYLYPLGLGIYSVTISNKISDDGTRLILIK